jgi:hypothetical protein
VLLFFVGAVSGTLLVTFRGLVPLRFGDCFPPPGSPPGCFTMGHPYWWLGVLVWIACVLGARVLWRIGTNLAAGRTMAGRPREGV